MVFSCSHRIAARALRLHQAIRPADRCRRASSTPSSKRKEIPGPRTPPFGIVVALTNDNVIGIDGTLPWAPLDEDRAHFVALTRDKILIVGRRTYAEEDPTMAHIDHARVCVVVSTTLLEAEVEKTRKRGGPKVEVARSFDEALEVASEALSSHANDTLRPRNDVSVGNDASDGPVDGDGHSNEVDAIDCWVAGGEGIYREALVHDSAREVHLTHVDVSCTVPEGASVAYFPVEYLERCGFEEVSRVERGACAFSVYRRRLPYIEGAGSNGRGVR